VGSNACKTCHADVWLNFYKNPHFKSVASGDLPLAAQVVKAATGRAKRSGRARGRPPFRHAFSLMPQARVLEACLTCHARDFQKVNIRRSEHTLAISPALLPFHSSFTNTSSPPRKKPDGTVLRMPRRHPRTGVSYMTALSSALQTGLLHVHAWSTMRGDPTCARWERMRHGIVADRTLMSLRCTCACVLDYRHCGRCRRGIRNTVPSASCERNWCW